MKHNAMSALLLVGRAVMSYHYRRISDCHGMWANGNRKVHISQSRTVSHRRAEAYLLCERYQCIQCILSRAIITLLSAFGIDDPNMSTYAGKKQNRIVSNSVAQNRIVTRPTFVRVSIFGEMARAGLYDRQKL